MHIEWSEIVVSGRLGAPRHALPPFLGPTLRGAVGYCLKDMDKAVYDLLFEGLAGDRALGQDPPSPMLLRLPEHAHPVEGGCRLTFGVRLLGPAVHHWRDLALALAEAGRRGLGSRRVPWVLESIQDCLTGATMTDGSQPNEIAVTSGFRPTPMMGRTCRWRFRTPVRIRTHSRDRQTLDGLTLLRATRQRLDLLNRCLGSEGAGLVDQGRPHFEQDHFVTREDTLRPVRVDRFSTRQHRRMILTGLVGTITIEGPWEHLPEIHAMPVYHIGKATSFGFGRVELEPVDNA